MPMTTTSEPNASRSHKDQPLEGAVGFVATSAGVLAGSEDMAVVADVVSVVAGVVTGSAEEL